MIVDLIEKVEKTKKKKTCNLSLLLCQSSISFSHAKTQFDEVQLHEYASKYKTKTKDIDFCVMV
jgi:hypothetical protein